MPEGSADRAFPGKQPAKTTANRESLPVLVISGGNDIEGIAVCNRRHLIQGECRRGDLQRIKAADCGPIETSVSGAQGQVEIIRKYWGRKEKKVTD
jgi:hypothetical protein